MPKGKEKLAKNNQPKLSTKEKQKRKKDKAVAASTTGAPKPK